MKQETKNTKKQSQPAGGKTAKPACGTLSYIADCRGVQKKTGSFLLEFPDNIDKIVRK